MRTYRSSWINLGYLFYRLIRPVFDPIKFGLGVYGYFWFLRDILKFKSMDKNAQIRLADLFPVLDEKVSYTPFDAHYFYQQLWVFENILKSKPKKHVDVASTYQMSGYISLVIPTEFIDIRPIKAGLKNLTIKKGDILNLPYKDRSVESLSCLHVIEHIGLGRYGDNIDPEGTFKACRELSRVLACGETLYLSCPIGKPRICFNAHRVLSPSQVVEYFSDLELVSFSVVNDDGLYIAHTNPQDYENVTYSCGMFKFQKR